MNGAPGLVGAGVHWRDEREGVACEARWLEAAKSSAGVKRVADPSTTPLAMRQREALLRMTESWEWLRIRESWDEEFDGV
jgi:hypothetical protein